MMVGEKVSDMIKRSWIKRSPTPYYNQEPTYY